MKDEFIAKCVTIRKDQQAFLDKQERFKLSKFVQSKMDEYIKLMKEYKEFIPNEKTIN